MKLESISILHFLIYKMRQLQKSQAKLQLRLAFPVLHGVPAKAAV